MEKIFAPWRAQYILSNSDDKEKIDGCIFCEFPKRDEDEKRMIIERGKYCFVIMNAYPYNPGHLMVVPYRHTADFTSLTAEEFAGYDTILFGFPIWWGQAPKVIYTFLESCDFGDAAIVPFCTSGSSGIGSSADGLQELTENARWLDGQRFSGSASQNTVASWVQGLDLPESSPV